MGGAFASSGILSQLQQNPFNSGLSGFGQAQQYYGHYGQQTQGYPAERYRRGIDFDGYIDNITGQRLDRNFSLISVSVPVQTAVKPIIKEKSVMGFGYVKEYFTKHRELVMGVVIALLLDHYVFKNAFREKLQKIVHGILDKTEKKLIE